MKKYILAAILLALAITSPASVSAQQTADSVALPKVTDLLQPGDVIRVRVWREPELSGDFMVDKNGEIVFPKIGLKKVTETPPPALKQRLIADYSVYLRDPLIEIFFLRRISVSGEVNKPGMFHLDPTQTVADAIVLAGGVTELGRNDVVQLRRNGKIILANLRRDDRIADAAIASGDQLYVPERNWVSRNPGAVAAIGSGIVGLFTTIVVLVLTRN